MRPRALPPFLVAALAVAALAAPASAAALTMHRCGRHGWECGWLTVPGARSSGVHAGTLELYVWRHKFGGEASGAHSASAVFALAGGPGQAAVPLREGMRELIAPALKRRDLIVIDQRGTGRSSPLECRAIRNVLRDEEASEAIEQCEHETLAKGVFTSAESAEDIDAVRAALGYERLVLYGTSYGTKVALNYAERHPGQVESMVLDSVVPAAGVEPLDIPSFKAVDRVVRELCSEAPCSRFAPNPDGELRRLLAHLANASLFESYVTGSGRKEEEIVSAAGIWNLLLEGDLNPGLRALLPAAVHAALRGEVQPLVRLAALAEGSIPTLPHEEGGGEEEVNAILNVATVCEDTTFPWSRANHYYLRYAEAEEAARLTPAADFSPFTRQIALAASEMALCAAWPDAVPIPAAGAPLPAVPTLVISGAQDLRTPTEQARAVAATIPGAQLLVVPFTGHSALGTDLTPCARDSVRTFFSGAPVKPCPATRDPVPPPPPPPTSLRTLRRTAAIRGRAGRTVTAVLATLETLRYERLAAAFAEGYAPPGSTFGGLAGGKATVRRGRLVLRDYSVVPGVTLDGVVRTAGLRFSSARLTVGGRSAAHGSLTVEIDRGRLRGRLGGHRFDRSTAARLAAASAAEQPASLPPGPVLR